MGENVTSLRTSLDLRGTPCPINFIRCKLAIEELSEEDFLEVLLDKGEPEIMVISGLKEEGHNVQIVQQDTTWLRLLVVRGVR